MSETETPADDGAAADTALPEGGEQTTAKPEEGSEQQQTETKPEGKQDEGTVLTGEDQGAPEEYAAFEVPEGFELDEKLVEAAAPVFKELNLSQGQAQKLADTFAAYRQAEAQELQDAFNADVQKWKQEAESDKEIGGSAFKENVGTAVKALDRFGTSELKSLLESTGLGNHPEVIRFMHRVGKTISEDKPISSGQAQGETQDMTSRWYQDTTQGAN